MPFRSTRMLGPLTAILLFACAQPYPPPGGPPDREPPRLLATRPEQQAVLTEWEGPVEFTFDETLSENGIRDAVLVSPETGAASIKRDGTNLKVSVEGGWQPNWSWGEKWSDVWMQAKQEWSGILTLGNLRTLRSFGRIDL